MTTVTSNRMGELEKSFELRVVDLPKLALPEAPMTLRTGNGTEVLCPVRRRWVKLEPEEWVRQHWLHYLSSKPPLGSGYPLGSIGVEVALELNGTKRRADAICHDSSGKPVVLLEFKAPNIPVTQATLDQALRYNIVLALPYLVLSNGNQHFVYSTPSGGEPVSLSAVPALFSPRNPHS